MKREDIRRENARALAAEVGGPAEFGRKVGMDATQVSHIIGDNFIRNIGNTVAPRIEDAFGKKRGWLDVRHLPGDVDEEELSELVDLYRKLSPHGRVTVMSVVKGLAGSAQQDPP